MTTARVGCHTLSLKFSDSSDCVLSLHYAAAEESADRHVISRFQRLWCPVSTASALSRAAPASPTWLHSCVSELEMVPVMAQIGLSSCCSQAMQLEISEATVPMPSARSSTSVNVELFVSTAAAAHTGTLGVVGILQAASSPQAPTSGRGAMSCPSHPPKCSDSSESFAECALNPPCAGSSLLKTVQMCMEFRRSSDGGVQ